jgi:hypothetical protein
MLYQCVIGDFQESLNGYHYSKQAWKDILGVQQPASIIYLTAPNEILKMSGLEMMQAIALVDSFNISEECVTITVRFLMSIKAYAILGALERGVSMYVVFQVNGNLNQTTNEVENCNSPTFFLATQSPFKSATPLKPLNTTTGA